MYLYQVQLYSLNEGSSAKGLQPEPYNGSKWIKCMDL